MAHKKRRDESESDVDLPEFDEADFMRKDIEATKASVWSILWSVPAALVAFGITFLFGAPVVALAVGVAFLFGLRYILPALRVATKAFKTKDWLGHGGMFFMSFLAFWILLMNPPFSDFTPPDISAITVNGVSLVDNSVRVNVSASTWVMVNVTAGDNVALESVTLEIPGAVPPTLMNSSGGARWWLYVDLGSAAQREATVTGVDRTGASVRVTFMIVPY